ncbi:hypothetical protein [uncultured Chryseobacterium sp.]|uniref:hypothetical protein n=1 Tax=uncultured Chryseobacterium sp. TaxID=259322 RepID=UPI0025DDE934|nr:hypothetical protein [uncultured Chryseobacterium sp.]
MKIHFKLTVILFFTIYCQFFAQINKLKAKMEWIITSKHAVVEIAVKDSNPTGTINVFNLNFVKVQNFDKVFQSLFKINNTK